MILPIKQFDTLLEQLESFGDTVALILYFITMPIFCLHWAWVTYLPIILNRIFDYPDNIQFAAANPSWGYIHTFFYNCLHPPMGMAQYFNQCDWKLTYLFTMLPAFWIIYTIIFCLLYVVVYAFIWNYFIAPAYANILHPIINTVLKK